MTFADVMAYLQAVERGNPVGHPADVVAASRGILSFKLARERCCRRARGMVLELQSLREQLHEWPGEELKTTLLRPWKRNYNGEYHQPRFPLGYTIRAKEKQMPLKLGGARLRGTHGGYMSAIMV